MKATARLTLALGVALCCALPGCAQTDATNVTDAANLKGNNSNYIDADGDAPPVIKTSLTYRCEDNTLALVEYLADDVTAIYRGRVADEGQTLVASAPGKPFVNADYSMSGSTSKIELQKPGKDAVICTA